MPNCIKFNQLFSCRCHFAYNWNMSVRVLKRIAVGILLIPVTFLCLFAFGEALSGDVSGLFHLIQALPLLLLVLLSYKKPFVGGVILMVLSLILGITYLLRAKFDFKTVFLVELLLFIPPFISGLFLVLFSKKSKDK